MVGTLWKTPSPLNYTFWNKLNLDPDFFFFFFELSSEPRVLYLVGKFSTTELNS